MTEGIHERTPEGRPEGIPEGTAESLFAGVRPLLFTVAYEIVGSAADAEDVVQDAWLRWAAADRTEVRDPRAYLVRVATNLALNRLRSARARRESYVGPWLPEPVLTAPDVADDVETAEAVSMALLVVLETLSPLERAVFVLREVFGFSHQEVADALDRSEAAVRQTARRARRHVEARRPRFVTDRRTQDEVTRRFMAAILSGELDPLLATLSPGVTLVTDGGGRARAALRPIVGARKVATFLAAVTAEGRSQPDLTVEVVDVNAAPAVVVRTGGTAALALQVHAGAGGTIDTVHIVLNPDKLTALDTPRHVAVH